jgi:hypothetical protein
MIYTTSNDANVPPSSFKNFPPSSYTFSSPSRPTRLIASPSSNVRDITQRWRSRIRHSLLNVATRWVVPAGDYMLWNSESVVGEGCGVFLVEAFTKQPNISKRQPLRVFKMSYGVERSSRWGCPQTQSTGVHSRSYGSVPTPKLRSEFAYAGRRNVGNYLSMLLNVRTHK